MKLISKLKGLKLDCVKGNCKKWESDCPLNGYYCLFGSRMKKEMFADWQNYKMLGPFDFIGEYGDICESYE